VDRVLAIPAGAARALLRIGGEMLVAEASL